MGDGRARTHHHKKGTILCIDITDSHPVRYNLLTWAQKWATDPEKVPEMKRWPHHVVSLGKNDVARPVKLQAQRDHAMHLLTPSRPPLHFVENYSCFAPSSIV